MDKSNHLSTSGCHINQCRQGSISHLWKQWRSSWLWHTIPSAIEAMMYPTNHTTLDIYFTINLLTRFSSPKKKNTHTLRYIWGTCNLWFFYPNDSKESLLRCACVAYFIISLQGKLSSWITCTNTTSSNHAKIKLKSLSTKTYIECVWLRFMHKSY